MYEKLQSIMHSTFWIVFRHNSLFAIENEICRCVWKRRLDVL